MLLPKIYITEFCFDVLFRYAEEHFDIGWSAANDMFFGNVLVYGSWNKVEVGDWGGYVDPEIADKYETALSIPIEVIKAMVNSVDQSYVILNHFLEYHHVNTQYVLIDGG